jgi:hypothetical protein
MGPAQTRAIPCAIEPTLIATHDLAGQGAPVDFDGRNVIQFVAHHVARGKSAHETNKYCQMESHRLSLII